MIDKKNRRGSFQEEIQAGINPEIAKLGRIMPENICTPHERKALSVLKMLAPADILEYVDSIATAGKQGCDKERRRQQRLVGMLCALSDARAALDA